jgi:hypothetical protein
VVVVVDGAGPVCRANVRSEACGAGEAMSLAKMSAMAEQERERERES